MDDFSLQVSWLAYYKKFMQVGIQDQSQD